jgi:glycosyltransferase involved in cell wall biosynthesis
MSVALVTEAWPSRAPADAQDAAPGILLDLSRLLSRLAHPTPTGVDRVEMAYALDLQRLAPQRLAFVAAHPAGWHGRLPHAAALDFLHLTAERWEAEGQGETRTTRWRRAAQACLALTPRPTPKPALQPQAYLHLSSRGLERRAMLAGSLKREHARFIPFIHDLIPLEHPEYARPRGAQLFARKLAVATGLASGALCNSEATARALAAYLAAQGRTMPIRAVGLGASFPQTLPIQPPAPATARPYFVALGTIEPRKNHLLLLHIWRRMIEQLGPERTPRLLLVGRRGWENEMVLDLLDRTPSFGGVVRELGRVPDHELRSLLPQARAVLIPSFAEGFGLPVVEALAMGAPVVASDLPALREAGGEVADYLDPLDGAAWMRAIQAYADPNAPRRLAQLVRLKSWRPPSWDAHLRQALDFIDEVCR